MLARASVARPEGKDVRVMELPIEERGPAVIDAACAAALELGVADCRDVVAR
jgi:hypothetical protein